MIYFCEQIRVGESSRASGRDSSIAREKWNEGGNGDSENAHKDADKVTNIDADKDVVKRR